MMPTHYTDSQGGQWFVWQGGPVSDDTLAARDRYSVLINGNHVHSIAFDDPTQGNRNYRRWDCINGWTRRDDG